MTLSALSNPCQTCCHFIPAAITPGISLDVTSRGSLSCASARADPQRQYTMMSIIFDFIGPPDCRDQTLAHDNRGRDIVKIFLPRNGPWKSQNWIDNSKFRPLVSRD